MDMTQQLRDGVWRAYTSVAEQPEAEHPFAVGQQFAMGLGYSKDVLDRLPVVSVQAFTGVSNVAVFADLPRGAQVLDLGCGAGVDALIAAQRVEPEGAVLGVDFSPAMLRRARQATAEAGIGNAFYARADAERLPLDSASVDAVLVNGLFNLNPARAAIFGELARVVKPGGAVFAAELILREPAPAPEAVNPDDWFA